MQELSDVRQLFALQVSALQNCAENANIDALYKAVDAICKSRSLTTTGVGKSGIIAQKAAATFTSIGKPTSFLHPVDALHGDLGLVGQGNSTLVYSNSGNAEELLTLIPYLKKRNSTIIAIVGNVDSALSKQSDIVLATFVQQEICPLNLVPTNSSLVAMALSDILAVLAMSAMQTTPEDFAINHPAGLLGRKLALIVGDIMHTGDAVPTIGINAMLKEAIIVMSKKSLGGVVVVNESQEIVGLLTDGDIRRVLEHNDDIRNISAAEVMTKNPTAIHANALAGEALSLMEQRRQKISVLPVVNENNGKVLVGFLRMHDIVS